jgi:biopolymer transport protein ExbD
MAGGMDLGTSGRGKKKPLDTAINLVPFIDLMAVTISFLIMTAVWNQVARLQVAQSGGPRAPAPPTEAAAVPLALLVSDRGFSLTAGSVSLELPRVGGTYRFCHLAGADRIDGGCDEKSLVGALRKVKADLPQQRTITVQCDDGIRYQDLVKVLDACNLKDSAGNPLLFPEIAVSASS